MPLLSNGPSRILRANSGALAVPVPTLGNELITNGGFEAWASATDATGWTEAKTGTSTVNQDTSIYQAGAAAARLNIDASNSAAYLTQAPAVANNQWTLLSYWLRTTAGKTGRISDNNKIGIVSVARAPGTTWTQYISVQRALADASSAAIYAERVSANSASVWFDNVSLKAITLASMFSARSYFTHATTKAKATIVAGTRAGVVANLDSATSPANFVIASHDGTNARLTKCVAGTYTELVSTAVTYVAGAFVEIRRLAGTDTFQLFYNGSQVGTNQTISDAGIVSNTLAGYFNTYTGNTLADFSCVASA